MRKRAAKAFDLYGSLVRIWVLLFPFFVVLQPEDLQVILSSKKHTNKVFIYRLMHNFLGDGLITSSGNKWSTHRKLIQPAFHLSLLEKFIDTFVDASQSLNEHLDASALDMEVNIAKYVNNCVVDVLNGKSYLSKQFPFGYQNSRSLQRLCWACPSGRRVSWRIRHFARAS